MPPPTVRPTTELIHTHRQHGHCAQKSDHHSWEGNDIGDHLMGEIRSRHHDQRRKQQSIESSRPSRTESTIRW